MRIPQRLLFLVPALALASACVEDITEPVPDAGTDAGADAGSVTGELTVASLWSGSSGEGTQVEAEHAAGVTRSLGTPIEPAEPGPSVGVRSRIAAPSQDDRARLLRSAPTPKVQPLSVAPKGEQVIPGEFLIVPRSDTRAEKRLVSPDASHFAAALPQHRVREFSAPSSRLRHLHVTHADGRPLTVEQTRALTARLAADPTVQSVEPNRRVYAAAAPDDSFYPLQWHYPAIKLPRAWDVGSDASSVVVAVVDSGILLHPDLAPALLPGADLISDPTNAGDGDGRDMNPNDEGGDLPSGGSSWHGTHVAGTIGAVTNNRSGVAGVAWNTRILPVRALGRKGGSLADIAAAVSWAIGESVSGVDNNANPAHVVNMSLGGNGPPSPALQAVIDRAVQKGVIIAVAAGNEDEDTANKFPCNQEQVICVGATRLSPVRASYSNFGAQVDVMAPGGEAAEDQNNDRYPDGVLSTSRGTDSSGNPEWNYMFQQGTSMATPHVAGLLALMKSARATAGLPRLETELATSILKSTAYAGARCTEGCGAGLIDAYSALLRAAGRDLPVGPGELWVASASMQLIGTQTGRLLLSNFGGSALTVSAAFTSTDGGAVDFPEGRNVTLEPGASKSLAIRAPASLGEGRYAGTLVLTPSAGSALSVDIGIQVGPVAGDGLPVLLVFAYLDAQEEWQVGASGLVKPNASNRYLYRASEVPVGEYLVMGAVDDDEDGEYAEDGERLGVYPSMDSPVLVGVSKGKTTTGIDFTMIAQSSVEGVPDDGVVGRACTADTQCGSGYVCMSGSVPGGYCTRSCDSQACPTGSACYRFGAGDSTTRYCMATCTPPGGGQGSCRSGLLCLEDAAGEGYCHANCNDMAATFCGTTRTCSASGYCQ